MHCIVVKRTRSEAKRLLESKGIQSLEVKEISCKEFNLPWLQGIIFLLVKENQFPLAKGKYIPLAKENYNPLG